ncbi:MAG: hypothetical protein QOJ32_2927, partial [Frankiaceae bacterium]|nr:hypothetical protein [Frankiaceae bacterium]
MPYVRFHHPAYCPTLRQAHYGACLSNMLVPP